MVKEMNFIPKFVTEQLILRGPTIEDAISYEKYFVDWRIVSELASGVPWPYPKGTVADYFIQQIIPKQGNNSWVWGIFLKKRPYELIGCVDLKRDPHPANRGFWLGYPFWGKGYMNEALKPITDYAFDKLSFDYLILANALGNIRSRRLKEKAGAKLIRIEQAQYMNPKYQEREVWKLTKDDWLG